MESYSAHSRCGRYLVRDGRRDSSVWGPVGGEAQARKLALPQVTQPGYGRPEAQTQSWTAEAPAPVGLPEGGPQPSWRWPPVSSPPVINGPAAHPSCTSQCWLCPGGRGAQRSFVSRLRGWSQTVGSMRQIPAPPCSRIGPENPRQGKHQDVGPESGMGGS